MATEMDLAITCVRYLSGACYDRLIGETQIRHFTMLGHYAFLDYAAIYWRDHVRSCLVASGSKSHPRAQDQVADIVPLLQTFLGIHWDTTCSQVFDREVDEPSMVQRGFRMIKKSSPEEFHKFHELSRSSNSVGPRVEDLVRRLVRIP